MNNNYEKIQDIYFHDALVHGIVIDYTSQRLDIELSLYQKQKPYKDVFCRFNNFKRFDITNNIPWRKGQSIFEAHIVINSELLNALTNHIHDKTQFFHYNFVLTSGDEINIVSEKVELHPIELRRGHVT